jgi:hypothetical protein
MCSMTETGFRWQATIRLPYATQKWYVYEREPGVHRYSQHPGNETFRPLYAIHVTRRSRLDNSLEF